MSEPKKSPKAGKKSGWRPAHWRNRCAWCATVIKPNDPAFAISISLRPEAFKEFAPGSVQPLLLFSAGKTVAMMIVTDDSPAKKAGKDAMFQLCSRECATNLQAALQQELK
jgi:hypothetical protein